MQLLESKLKRQIQVVDNWYQTCNGVADCYMGFGKTYIAILAIRRLLKVSTILSVDVIVPSEALVKQWNRVLANEFTEDELMFIKVYSVNYITANSYKLHCDLLIVDEIHEFYSELRKLIWNGTLIKHNKFLGLTGTLVDKEKVYLELIEQHPVIDTITKAECVENNWIAKYIEYNIACELTPVERLAYDSYSEEIGKGISKFGYKNGLGIAIKCLQGGKDAKGDYYEGIKFAMGWAYRNGYKLNPAYSNIDQIATNKLWNPAVVMGYARNLMINIKKRKELVYNAEMKYERAIEVLNKYNNLKAIVFNQTTKMAHRIASSFPDAIEYHSAMKTKVETDEFGKSTKIGAVKLKARAIDSITNGKARVLSVVNAMDKGVDIPQLQLAVTTAGTQNPVTHAQRGARATRLNMDAKEETVLIVNLYIKSTKDAPSVDEKWLKKRQGKSTNDIYWIEQIDEIGFEV